MYVKKRVNWSIIWKFAWRFLLFFTLYSSLICGLFQLYGFKQLLLPFVPISLVGTAVAFYIGFKNNASYERLWEGRRIWGSIVNLSRAFGVMVLDYIESPTNQPDSKEGLSEIKRDLLYRQMAFTHALKNQLRRTTVWNVHDTDRRIVESHEEFRLHKMETELKPFLSETEIEEVTAFSNVATQLLRAQSQKVSQLHENGKINDLQQIELTRMIAALYDQQGACERIKGFPFPRQYAYFSFVFNWVFILILPFGLLGEFYKLGWECIWLTVPTYVLVSWIFFTMERVGDTSENPFENGINDVPMTAICRTIEIDLKEMLREAHIPPKARPVDGILM